MREFARPRVVVSQCLEFAGCRYNGLMISCDLVRALKPVVEFLPVCPELEIGLGCPRKPVRVIQAGGRARLLQPETGGDFTDKMTEFAASRLDSLREADGFILKSRSPSCGIKDVKIYASLTASAPPAKGAGFFGAAVLERFPHLAVEDEGRLTNHRIREHFLTRLFSLAAFRSLKADPSARALMRFQAENKLLFMAYNRKELRALGRIAANLEERPLARVLADYELHFQRVFARPARNGSVINVLLHALGHFPDSLTHREKAFFLDCLERFRAGKLPLAANLNLLRSWIARFGEKYLAAQSFFEPYPENLIDLCGAIRLPAAANTGSAGNL